MFLCDAYYKHRMGREPSFLETRSRGACEDCRTQASCVDIPSRFLPIYMGQGLPLQHLTTSSPGRC